MSSVQKKRKSTSSSRRKDGSSSRRSVIASGESAAEDADRASAKYGKKDAPISADSTRIKQLCALFVTVVCFLFYDAVHARHKIYNDVLLVPADDLVQTAQSSFQQKHRFQGMGVVLKETRETDILLTRSGAVDKPNFEVEGRQISAVLGLSNDNAESRTGNEEGNSLSLFQDNDEVLELEKKTSAKIEKRMGKNAFIKQSGGFDLASITLRGTPKIHEKHKLVDYFQLAKEHSSGNRIGDSDDDDQGDGDDINSAAGTEGESTSADGSAPAKRAPRVLSRKMAFEERTPNPLFLKFIAELRSDNTYAHLGKRNDLERSLKTLGYKQSTKSSQKAPLWIGADDSKGKCPTFKEDPRISFCAYFLPQNKADQYAHIQSFAEQVPNSNLKPDFYPATWRLYKEQERKALKDHCTNENMPESGEAFVRKFTVPGSNYMKSADSVYEQLMKSDRKNKELVKEAKNRAIIQSYVNNPLLIDERKFIIRTFAVIVNKQPMIVFYHDGAVFRSMVKYVPFTRTDSDYKKAAHITSEQKSSGSKKLVLKSSELYMSFNSLQKELTQLGRGIAGDYVSKVLRPQMKARMIYALYAILNRKHTTEEDSEQPETVALPRTTSVVQTGCFDFLLDDNMKLHLLTVATGSHCFINMGGSSFRPAWKAKLQENVSDNTAKLAEEMLWRRIYQKPMSSMRFFTKTGMTVLIDETFPDWDVTTEINNHMAGIQVEQDNSDYSQVENDDEEMAAGSVNDVLPDDDGEEEQDDDAADPEEEP
mmetsp:Transcript_7473/g.13001  ORF Transcript_7473/g.13001 Transcript_7473/m.13001 type:complete len:764 (+) Transcript_7473:271-2562(+)